MLTVPFLMKRSATMVAAGSFSVVATSSNSLFGGFSLFLQILQPSRQLDFPFRFVYFLVSSPTNLAQSFLLFLFFLSPDTLFAQLFSPPVRPTRFSASLPKTSSRCFSLVVIKSPHFLPFLLAFIWDLYPLNPHLKGEDEGLIPTIIPSHPIH